MDTKLRIVTNIPLTELWNDSGMLAHVRRQLLGFSDVAVHLRSESTRFVVADLGKPLQWIGRSPLLQLTQEIQGRIVEPAATERGFRLEDFPGEYAYIASEWSAEQSPSIVLLERYH
jgi:hypothetical protein